MGREKTGGGGRLWVLVALALTSCGSRKAEVCERLRPMLLAQFRAHDEITEHLRDAQACEAQARRLRDQVAELRALSVRDAALAAALGQYLTGLDELADAYGRAAQVHQGRPDFAQHVSPVEFQALAARLMARVTAVDGAGLSLLGACQEP